MGMVLSILTRFLGEDLSLKILKYGGIAVVVSLGLFLVMKSIENKAVTKERLKNAAQTIQTLQRDSATAKKIEAEDRDAKNAQAKRDAEREEKLRRLEDAANDKKNAATLDRVCIPRDLARGLRDVK